MALKDTLRAMNDLGAPKLQANNEEQVLAAAEIEVDSMFDYERPMVHSNINEA